MTNTHNVHCTINKRELYYNANSDSIKPRIFVDNTQELIHFHHDSSARIWYNDLNAKYDMHWHTAVEIIVPMENWYEFTVQNETIRAYPGDIVIIPPNELHSLTAPETGNRFIYLLDISPFSKLKGFASIQSILAKPYLLINKTSYPTIYTDIYNLLAQMRDEYFNEAEFAELSVSALMLNLLIKLGKNHIEQIDMLSGIRIYKQKEYIQKFNNVMEYIDAHYTDDLDLEQIASSIGFSKYHFVRLFKQYTNHTFCGYINHRRIKAAEELLEQPNLSITEIAMHSGFPSISTFNRLFKQQKGCTPSEYREKHHFNHVIG